MGGQGTSTLKCFQRAQPSQANPASFPDLALKLIVFCFGHGMVGVLGNQCDVIWLFKTHICMLVLFEATKISQSKPLANSIAYDAVHLVRRCLRHEQSSRARLPPSSIIYVVSSLLCLLVFSEHALAHCFLFAWQLTASRPSCHDKTHKQI